MIVKPAMRLFFPCLAIAMALLSSASARATLICSTQGQCIQDFTVAPCFNNEHAACTLATAFDEKQGNHWYVNYNGNSVTSTDGIGNTPFYIAVNGVYQFTVHTNNSNSPGAAVVVENLGVAVNVGGGPNSNSQGRGYCNAGSPNYVTFNETQPFLQLSGGYYIYSLSVPYSCPNG